MLYRGILNSLGMFGRGSLATVVAGIMFIIGVLFGAAAGVNMIVLLKVNSALASSLLMIF